LIHGYEDRKGGLTGYFYDLEREVGCVNMCGTKERIKDGREEFGRRRTGDGVGLEDDKGGYC
jgi:hypothetical protein